MTTRKQEREIKRLMQNINEAKKDGRSEEVIEKRTQELYQYLESEGLVNKFNE
jgi:hypothetical protein